MHQNGKYWCVLKGTSELESREVDRDLETIPAQMDLDLHSEQLGASTWGLILGPQLGASTCGLNLGPHTTTVTTTVGKV